jgi:DNA-binding NtrC family response regulator
MENKRILVVDDDRNSCQLLAEFLAGEGFQIDTAWDGKQALSMLEKETFDIVLTDLKMPKVNGIQVLESLSRTNPTAIGIIITGYGTIKSAIEAIRAGAYDYITKPVQLDEVKLTLERALEHQTLIRENITLKQQLKSKYRFENIIGDSESIQQIFRLIEKVADSNTTVLIYGESGTGKELVARAIHYNSPRADKSWIPVNCGAIPEGLLESELFGYEKGAFTGATKTRIGRFETAHQGTIFLDEVVDMSPALQVKLLRVLQDQSFERVGGVRTIKADVRILAATNRKLEEEVAKGRFREDLYYRLNVIPIVLPPLRDRKSDIPLLIQHFLSQKKSTDKRSIKGISPKAMELLMNYHWPGNIRELENLINRLLVLHNGHMVTGKELPEKIVTCATESPAVVPEIPPNGICLKSAVDEFEKQLILKALEKTKGVKKRAANILGLNRTTLVQKIKKARLEA